MKIPYNCIGPYPPKPCCCYSGKDHDKLNHSPLVGYRGGSLSRTEELQVVASGYKIGVTLRKTRTYGLLLRLQ